MKQKSIDLLTAICISYTIISLVDHISHLIYGTRGNSLNGIAQFLFSAIAVLVLYMHRLFENRSPLFMIVMQYIIAMGLVWLLAWLLGYFDPVIEGGYWDIFWSFTIPYAIGATYYYIQIFCSAKRQNALLQEIKRQYDKNGNGNVTEKSK